LWFCLYIAPLVCWNLGCIFSLGSSMMKLEEFHRWPPLLGFTLTRALTHVFQPVGRLIGALHTEKIWLPRKWNFWFVCLLPCLFLWMKSFVSALGESAKSLCITRCNAHQEFHSCGLAFFSSPMNLKFMPCLTARLNNGVILKFHVLNFNTTWIYNSRRVI
jgi:hypothetical protein